MLKLTLKAREERRLLRGHLWAYRNEFVALPEVPDGAVVDVVSETGRLVGRGFYQKDGGIGVRLLSDRSEEIDAGFLHRRVTRALRYREKLYPGETTYRWVFGESDGLPGLVADRYGSVVALETACTFYADLGETLAQQFLDVDGITGVRLQCGNRVQRYGDAPRLVECTSFGVKFTVNLDEGQKTGLFLDQRENCLAAAPFFRDARVFDGFCYTGQWGLHAARAGAASVVSVDSSAPALEMAKTNAALNGYADKITHLCSDVTAALKGDTRYDVVAIDPPALAKARSQMQKALGHYQALNRDAMAAVEPGGYLITSSCSHFVDSPGFLEILKRAARSAQRAVWIVEERTAAKDHPILMAMPETTYLKCVILRVF